MVDRSSSGNKPVEVDIVAMPPRVLVEAREAAAAARGGGAASAVDSRLVVGVILGPGPSAARTRSEPSAAPRKTPFWLANKLSAPPRR